LQTLAESAYRSGMATLTVQQLALPQIAAVLLAGCSSAPPVGSETIVYETSCGFCLGTKQFALRLHPDGRGEFVGNRYTAVPKGAFTASAAQVRAFAEQLAPYRPNGVRLLTKQGRQCEQYAHDGGTYDIQWRGPGGKSARLTLYSGCDPDKHAEMLKALHTAPDLLPLKALMGPEDYVPPAEPAPPACAVHPETCKPPLTGG
jgi:hypothetical protein